MLRWPAPEARQHHLDAEHLPAVAADGDEDQGTFDHRVTGEEKPAYHE